MLSQSHAKDQVGDKFGQTFIMSDILNSQAFIGYRPFREGYLERRSVAHTGKGGAGPYHFVHLLLSSKLCLITSLGRCVGPIKRRPLTCCVPIDSMGVSST